MSPIERQCATRPRQHFSTLFFMQVEGGSLSLRACACACLHLTIFDPNRILKTMPHNTHVRASWRLCDRRARRNNEDNRRCKR